MNANADACSCSFHANRWFECLMFIILAKNQRSDKFASVKTISWCYYKCGRLLQRVSYIHLSDVRFMKFRNYVDYYAWFDPLDHSQCFISDGLSPRSSWASKKKRSPSPPKSSTKIISITLDRHFKTLGSVLPPVSGLFKEGLQTFTANLNKTVDRNLKSSCNFQLKPYVNRSGRQTS